MHKSIYWVHQSFTDFTFFQHRQLHKVSLNYNAFIFRQFIKLNKNLNIKIKNLYIYRFISFFFLINPFCYQSWTMRNFFFLNNFVSSWFNFNRFYTNNDVEASLILNDFNSTITYTNKNNVFVDFFFLSNSNLFYLIFVTFNLSLLTFQFRNSNLLHIIFFFLFVNL
jgi:hypothetical protein